MTHTTTDAAEVRALDRAEAFAKSPNTTPEEHDDIMVAVRLARRATAEAASDRQPIITAPRDGTHILGWHDIRMPPVVVHYWDAVGEEGFYLSLGASGDWDKPIELCDWMPLPMAPRVNAECAGDWQGDTPSVRAAAMSAEAASGAAVTAATATDDQLRRIQLLADVELHLKSCRIFLTSREKMHPCGIELHDELLANVTAAIEQEGRNG